MFVSCEPREKLSISLSTEKAGKPTENIVTFTMLLTNYFIRISIILFISLFIRSSLISRERHEN